MGGAVMPCDHSPMGVTGADRSVVCVGCGSEVGKFTCAACGAIFTTGAASAAHAAEHGE